MAKLVDATGLGPVAVKGVSVRVRSLVPLVFSLSRLLRAFFFLPFYIGATRIGVPLIARFYRRHAVFSRTFSFSSCMLEMMKSVLYFPEFTSSSIEIAVPFLRGYP